MVDLISFSDAIADSEQFSKRHLILGNGFSIGCCPNIFHYESLFESADFSNIPKARQLFDIFDTRDFEIVIRALENSIHTSPIYMPNNHTAILEMENHSEKLKELLVQTIASNHPAKPAEISIEKFISCRKFLSNFLVGEKSGQVYTLNYDLLLYWTLMQEDPLPTKQLKINDGFGDDINDSDAEYVVWQGETKANGQCIHYLHGALHLFDAGDELKKYTWVRKGTPLIVQARQAINENAYPLFVTEGSSKQKKNKIRHNAYLYHSYKSLVSNTEQTKPCFFVLGHSLAENDKHILDKLGRGKFPKLYIGIFGDPESRSNKNTINAGLALARLRQEKFPLSISFYDSKTANTWGN